MRRRVTRTDGLQTKVRVSGACLEAGGRQVRLFTNWRLTAATKQRTSDDADLCSLCALKMLLADQEVRATLLYLAGRANARMRLIRKGALRGSGWVCLRARNLASKEGMCIIA